MNMRIKSQRSFPARTVSPANQTACSRAALICGLTIVIAGTQRKSCIKE